MKQALRKKTTIFRRMIVRLTIPLMFLALIFVVMQVTNEVNAMNRLSQMESRLAFEYIQKALQSALNEPELAQKPELLEKKMTQLLPFENKPSIQIYDVYDKNTLLPENVSPWTPADEQAVERSLFAKEQGKPYYIQIDKQAKRLIAYIPAENEATSTRWVARLILPLTHFQEALYRSRHTLIIMSLLILFIGIVIGHGLANSIAKPIETLNSAAHEIMQGKLDRKVSIRTGDELQMLAETFNHMSSALQIMKERDLNANPLTQLPGNPGIEAEIHKRIQEMQKFVFFHADLNRFKTFNDHYGLAKGDEAIMKTADILKSVIKTIGAENDFIGHQGGDDFVLILKPKRAKEIAETIIKRFDSEAVKSLYPAEDYARGYTLAYDRRTMAESGGTEAKLAKFPLLSIALAGVSNAKKSFANYNEILKSAVSAKDAVKKNVESAYLIVE